MARPLPQRRRAEATTSGRELAADLLQMAKKVTNDTIRDCSL
jgi:hypothetical protein